MIIKSIGLRTILFGVHQPIIHYYFVLLAWIKLYGLTRELLDPRLHISFFLHDVGYIFCHNDLDGEDGDMHPILGSLIVGAFFGTKWQEFCLHHSGTMVDSLNKYRREEDKLKPSKLYAADKLASVLYPKWLYKLLSGWSGEWKQYMSHEKDAPIDFETWHSRAINRMKVRAATTKLVTMKEAIQNET